MIINIKCPNCDFTKKVPQDKIPEGIKYAKCPRCSKTFELPTVSDQETGIQEAEDIIVPDNSINPQPETASPDEIGYFTILWKTFIGVLFAPSGFFRSIRTETGFKDSILFGMLLGSIGAMLGIFWQFLLQSSDVLYISRIMPDSISTNLIFIGLISISPFLVLINVLLTTLVLHFFLFILGGANKGFEGTLRVALYSNATSIFNFIPYIGSIIAFFWNCSVLVIGLREVHDTSTLRALFALLLPFILLFILGIFAVIYVASLVI